MTSALEAAYRDRLVRGDIRPDPAQAAALPALARLEADLAASEPGGLFGRLRKPQSQKGVYLWGPVGRGKSMLMDLFY
ncbi:MAG: AFG1/ZapE family ATPase, partial [Phenylobacterium sp.]|nr:AFG1/ZapE family ATPase [Phenylobacterium sp.]